MHHFMMPCVQIAAILCQTFSNRRCSVAVITGSRFKIGYHITLMLLRGGATVIATTRFPVDSALRFSKEDDFMEWGHRLKIHGLIFTTFRRDFLQFYRAKSTSVWIFY
jgi:hypothetical protein